jgi:hypothetical protein
MELKVALYGQQARLPFKVGGPSSRSITDLGRSPSMVTGRIPRSADLLAVSCHDLGRSLRHKPGGSSVIWMRSPEVFLGCPGCG